MTFDTTTPTTNIGPGLGAFLSFFVLALALWLLMRNMNARMRRIAYRERAEQEAATGQAADLGDARTAEEPQDPGVA
ncbi:MAG TPA: hypothetical protein VHM65_02000 [Candidatus Lustribacter sp.]|nr:hypothetical protein [Candidatus Lustribacter sp.]